MIILWILLAIGLAFLIALVVVGAGSVVTKQARKMIRSGRIDNIKQARETLKALGSMPKDMKTRETDELYDDLKRLIERAEVKHTGPVGFKRS